MPTSWSPSTTGSEPTFSDAMSFAASVTDALPAIVVGFSVIEERTVVLCIEWPPVRVREESSPPARPQTARAERTPLGELDPFDRHGLDGPVASVGVGLRDGVGDVHSLRHPAEHGVLPVQPRALVGG